MSTKHGAWSIWLVMLKEFSHQTQFSVSRFISIHSTFHCSCFPCSRLICTLPLFSLSISKRAMWGTCHFSLYIYIYILNLLRWSVVIRTSLFYGLITYTTLLCTNYNMSSQQLWKYLCHKIYFIWWNSSKSWQLYHTESMLGNFMQGTITPCSAVVSYY